MRKTSRRSKITNAIANLLKQIDGTGDFASHVYENVHPKQKFWDEVQQFPYISVVAGDETREYLPANFKWGYLLIKVRVYVKDNYDPQEALENIFSDIEMLIDDNLNLEYESNETTEDIRIVSISTDEGLFAPTGVGEMVLRVQYDL